jgi:hypothetical protein
LVLPGKPELDGVNLRLSLRSSLQKNAPAANFGLLPIILLYYNSFIEVWRDLRGLT